MRTQTEEINDEIRIRSAPNLKTTYDPWSVSSQTNNHQLQKMKLKFVKCKSISVCGDTDRGNRVLSNVEPTPNAQL